MQSRIALYACMLIILSCSNSYAELPWCRPSLVYYGWDIKDTSYLRVHWREIDATSPFDGMGIKVAINPATWATGNTSTSNQLGWKLFGKEKFSIDQFFAQIGDLQSTAFTNVTDNLLPVILSSGYNEGLSWFDDNRWNTALANLDVLAQIMAASGIKNILMDPEHYNNYRMFSYATQSAARPASREDYYWRVRLLGQLAAYIIQQRVGPFNILSLYGYTLPARSSEYDLLPAFFDGILDVLATQPGSTFTDGYESAYGYKKFDQFVNAVDDIHSAVGVSGNPDAYATLLKVGFGLWADYLGNTAYFTPTQFGMAALYAKLLASKFVWIYSQGMGMLQDDSLNPPYLQALRQLQKRCQ
jgi:hypothetical protein